MSKKNFLEDFGIKRNRLDTIIDKFKDLRILNVSLQTYTSNGGPRQINRFSVNPGEIVELATSIFKESAVDAIRLLSDYRDMYQNAIGAEN